MKKVFKAFLLWVLRSAASIAFIVLVLYIYMNYVANLI